VSAPGTCAAGGRALRLLLCASLLVYGCGAAAPALKADPEQAPAGQSLVFFNARTALREENATEVLKLWLLHNALEDQGQPARRDEEFLSLLWAALGSLGLCQDGLPKDDQESGSGGAGLWPLALHNQVIRSLSRGEAPDQPPPFGAFEVGRQQRFISLHDVLSGDELRSVTFFRTSCLLPRLTTLTLTGSLELDLGDRLSAGKLLRQLLVKSLQTLRRDKVQSLAALEARIFDLDLALAELEARRARREGLAAGQRATGLGVSEAGAREVREEASRRLATSEHVAFLARSLTWKASEWLTLSRQRRLFLFSQARPLATDPRALLRLELELIDALIERREGEELEVWLGTLGADFAAGLRAVVTSGERGKRLLELDPATGFHERAVVALDRGVALLAEGQLQESLRSFAYALGKADESRAAAEVTSLARRWLSFSLSRFQTDEEVVATLKALLPVQERNAVFGDLVWRAALRSDARSFQKVVENLHRGGAFDAQVEKLSLLARGKPGELGTQLRDAAAEEPYFTLRFLRLLIEKLEAEEVEVRRASAPLLRLVPEILAAVEAKGGRSGSRNRAAEEVAGRAQAILEALELLDRSAAAKARTLAPGHEAFAGNVRLAPADPLPWPFRPPSVEAPSAFVPLVLQPVEWRGRRGELVFGWRLTE
jgi:hypothetical protein